MDDSYPSTAGCALVGIVDGMSDPARRVLEVIDSGVASVLDEHGFVRRDLAWNRKIDNAVQVVDAQLSGLRGMPGLGPGFYLNLGVWFHAVSGQPPRFVDAAASCQPRFRIASVSAGAPDEWQVDSSVDADAMVADLAGRLRNDVIPWFDHFTTPDTLAAWAIDRGEFTFLGRTDRMQRAVIFDLQERSAEATRNFVRPLIETSGRERHGVIDRVAMMLDFGCRHGNPAPVEVVDAMRAAIQAEQPLPPYLRRNLERIEYIIGPAPHQIT